MHLLLGTIYGWSVFKRPLMSSHGWSSIQVSLTFTLAIFIVDVSAAFGGRFVDRAGARKIAILDAVLFGTGTLVAGLTESIGNLFC